ncbi:MAG: folate family ECF transporter S component [Lachnospiraceae bacterium]|nr:folate family ECF transporter S component [Lachnospiraceae bacterium]MDD6169792.1 folate family ECF transporter S component [Lachnospiraceae bacterium]MDY4838480.1 folate family ECF transporter S component [Lachnospiraceae bacterium]
MKKFIQTLQSSLHELSTTKNLVLCGLMAALAIILGTFASISVGPYIKIGFSSIPNRIVDCMFGPVVGCLFGGALDLLKFLVKPDGPFFFGFTFDAMLAGFLYGIILYKKPLKWQRVLAAEFVNKLIVNCGFNTLWISILYGKGFFVLFPARILKNLIMLPIDTVILFFALTLMKQIAKQFGFGSKAVTSQS